MFLYYGKQHLFINLFQYIKAGIENNELIYVSMNPELYSRLITEVVVDKDKEAFLEFFSLPELICLYNSFGITPLRYAIKEIIKKTSINGFSGIRIIGQPSYVIKQTSKEEFFCFEEDLSKVLYDMKCSLLCIYEFEDYMNARKTIDQEIYSQALETHKNILYHLELMPVDTLSPQ